MATALDVAYREHFHFHHLRKMLLDTTALEQGLANEGLRPNGARPCWRKERSTGRQLCSFVSILSVAINVLRGRGEQQFQKQFCPQSLKHLLS